MLLRIAYFILLLVVLPVVCRASGSLPSATPVVAGAGPGESLAAARARVAAGDLKGALALLEPFAAAPTAYPLLYTDYLVILFWEGRTREAVALFESLPASFPRRPYLLRNMAKAHRDLGRHAEAVSLYEETLGQTPADPIAREGLVEARILAGDLKGAEADLIRFLAETPDNVTLRLLMAGLLVRRGAYREGFSGFDAVLAREPGNPTALRYRAWAVSDMGAPGLAMEMAGKDLPGETDLADSLRKEAGAQRIRWGEPGEAVRILAPLVAADPKSPAAWDYIVALAEAGRHAEAVREYEARKGADPPDWVTVPAAGSYLYLDSPGTALSLYDSVLARDPRNRNARLGRFHALTALRKWEAAEIALQDLEKDPGPGDPADLDLAVERAWFLASLNRLREADERFGRLRREVPANLDVRSGEAHVHLWRGWPRKALEEFDIIATLDPDYLPAGPGRASALNALARKEEVRAEARRLNARAPGNRHVQRIRRNLELESRDTWTTWASASGEEDETYDLLFRTEVARPLSLYTRLYGFWLWRRTWNDDPSEIQRALGDDVPTYLRRGGMGIRHTFNSVFDLTQQVSVSTDDGREFGSYTLLDLHPDDHWTFSGSFDSFAFDVPKRARAAGTTARKIALAAAFRESEELEYRLSLSRQFFSDGNDRDEALLTYDRQFWAHGDWRFRISADLYGMWNSDAGAPDIAYFNPREGFSLSATPMIEQTVCRFADQAFVHRLFLTGGIWDQDGFVPRFTGALRYEQGHEFSDTAYLLWGISLGRNVYDGDPVGSAGSDIMFRWLF